MKILVAILVFAVLVAVAPPRACAGQVIDRLVASIDAVPILQSDWDEAVAFEALQQGRTIDSVNAAERRAVLERMVDQQLLRDQLGDSQIAAAEEREISKALDDLRKLYPAATSDDAWRRTLAAYGLTESSLRQKIRSQIEVTRFINLRLRPESRVARADVESYYNTTYVPEVQKRGEKPEELAAVSQKIEEILRQQRMDTLLSNWLQDLRSHSDIRWISPAHEGATETAAGEGH